MTTVDDEQKCPRCETSQRSVDFQGSVCGWCADDLERANQRTAMTIRQPGERPLRETLPVKPTSVWKIDWEHGAFGGRLMQPGELELEVTYNPDTDPVHGIPDRFQLLARHRGRGARTALVMSRQEAADLYTALSEALDWDLEYR